MRTESQATLIGLARKIEAGTSVTPMSIARALEQALFEQAKYQKVWYALHPEKLSTTPPEDLDF